MARDSLDKILQYFRSSLQYPAIELPPPPRVVAEQQARIAEFRETVIERCKTTSYSDRATTGVTLFARLESLGLTEKVFSDGVLSEIVCFLGVFEIEESERERLRPYKNLSTYGHAAQFHRSVLQELFRHVKTTEELCRDYTVDEKWFNKYRKGIHSQMLKEARALLPFYPFFDATYEPVPLNQSWGQVKDSVYHVLFSVLKSSGVNRGSKSLALQLTSVFCVASQVFPSGAIATAESIRRKIERADKSRTKSTRKPE